MSTKFLMDVEEDLTTSFAEAIPFLVIEILPHENRPEDSVVRIVPRIQRYLSIGVEYVWIIDPKEEAAMCFSQQDPRGAACDILRTENPTIEIPLATAFDLDA